MTSIYVFLPFLVDLREPRSSTAFRRLTVLSCFVDEKLLDLIVLERRGRRAEKENTDMLPLEAAAIIAQMHSNFSSVLDTAVIIQLDRTRLRCN